MRRRCRDGSSRRRRARRRDVSSPSSAEGVSDSRGSMTRDGPAWHIFEWSTTSGSQVNAWRGRRSRGQVSIFGSRIGRRSPTSRSQRSEATVFIDRGEQGRFSRLESSRSQCVFRCEFQRGETLVFLAEFLIENHRHGARFDEDAGIGKTFEALDCREGCFCEEVPERESRCRTKARPQSALRTSRCSVWPSRTIGVAIERWRRRLDGEAGLVRSATLWW